jgi:release factor glutamine methyltransferase
MSTSEAWTIGRLLKWTADHFRQHGSDSPRLDAEVLLAHARSCQRIELYTAFDEIAGDQLRSEYRQLVKRRSEGVPVAYLVGRKEFYSLSFQVSPDVLIPRPETEHLIVALLDKAKSSALSTPHFAPGEGAALQIADVGTGSGILAVCAAKHLPRAQVTAVDISAAALAVARQNAAALGVADRITFVESDLLAALPEDGLFDFVLSNPPYVGEEEFAQLERDVREHEPRLALVAGPRKVEVIERLIPQAAQHLRPGGWLLMEISPMIADAVQQLFTADGRFTAISIERVLAQQQRYVVAQRAS